MEARELNEQAHIMRRTVLLFAEAVLRPVIRILLRYGLSYPEFNQVSRKLFVDVAMHEAEFRIPRRRRQYKSRVALLTALSRKEVLRLLETARPSEDAEVTQSNRAARVLDGWLKDERYSDAKGRAVPLPFRSNGKRRSFSELVGEYSGDVPPRAILDELLATGTCIALGDDEIRVARTHYIARPFDVEVMTAAAMRATSILASIDEQLSPSARVRERADAAVTGQARLVHSA